VVVALRGTVAVVRDTCVVSAWLVIVAAFLAGVCVANAVSVRRYSPCHVVGEVAVRGRGLFFGWTPDGTWWLVRLRSRRCTTTYPADWGDAPANAGVREPRRPLGPGPLNAAVTLEPPGC